MFRNTLIFDWYLCLYVKIMQTIVMILLVAIATIGAVGIGIGTVILSAYACCLGLEVNPSTGNPHPVTTIFASGEPTGNPHQAPTTPVHESFDSMNDHPCDNINSAGKRLKVEPGPETALSGTSML